MSKIENFCFVDAVVYDNIENSRVLRGGSWSAHALDVRVSFRGADIPTFTSNDVGFRCVK